MEYLIKVSIILVLFYLCYRLLLNRETFFEANRSFLLFGLITAFVLPLITISKYIVVEPTNFVFDDTLLQSESVMVDNSIDFTTILAYIYITGTIFFLGRFLLQFWSLAMLLFNSTKQRVASFIYVITKKIVSPFSFFNWIVFNPNQFNDDELEQIIMHEKVHAKQLHSVDILLAEFICIILWFNPLVWLYKKDLKQNLEFIADRNAQATTNCKKSYQHLLLKTSVPNYQVALTNNFYNSSIKKRIVMLHKHKSRNRNQLKFLLILPLLVVFLMSFNTKEVYVEASPNQQKTVAVTQETETVETMTNDVETLKTESKPINSTTKATIVKNTAKSNTIDKQDIVTYFIESTFTDTKLDDVVKKLKDHGITLKIKGVKRNSNNEITAIKIDAKSNNSNANFSISNDTAINTIRITYNAKSNSISIGNTNSLIRDDKIFAQGVTIKQKSENNNTDHIILRDDHKIIVKKNSAALKRKKDPINKSGNTLIISGKAGKTFEIVTDTIEADGHVLKFKGNVAIKSNGKNKVYEIVTDTLESDTNIIKFKGNTTIKSKDANNEIFELKSGGGNVMYFNKGGNENPIYIVDGKKIKSKKIKDLDTNEITSVSVIKGEAATKKYGKNAKDGVVVISTKDGMNTPNIRFSNGDSEKALLVIDGKVAKNKTLKDIDVDTIKSVTVLKGESATKKYGKKGKDGIIEITLKKQ